MAATQALCHDPIYFSDIQTAIFYSSFRAPVPPKDTAARDGAKFLGSEPRHFA